MPGLLPSRSPLHVSQDSDSDSDGESDQPVWDIPLRLPSSLSADSRQAFCVVGLADKERRLREGQAEDSLRQLKRTLRTVSRLQKHRGLQTAGTGVKPNTRMQSSIAIQNERVDRLVERYQAARKALMQLDPNGEWRKRLLVLRKEDARPPRKAQGQAEGHTTLSWIWLTRRSTAADTGTQDEEFDESAFLQVLYMC